MSMPPRGWYENPGDPTRQRFWNGETWSGLTRPFRPPDIDGLQPGLLTFAAILLALAGSAMAIPFFVQSFSFGALPGETYPGWRQDLWYVAFVVGLASLGLAIASRYRERERRSRSGRRYSGVALALAIVGACVWSFPACIQASTGL